MESKKEVNNDSQGTICINTAIWGPWEQEGLIH